MATNFVLLESRWAWFKPRFARQFAIALLAGSAVIPLSGCSMCARGYVDDYATVGGKWQRSDPVHGRVGSPFSDPNYMQPLGMTTVQGESYQDEVEIESGMEFDEATGGYPSDSIIELDGSATDGVEPSSTIELGDDW